MLKNKKSQLIIGILLIVIIAGIIITFTKGMNYSLKYGENTTISVYLDTQVDVSEIKSTTTEIFGKNSNVKTVQDLNNYILITTKSSNEEQINTLISKVNAKYSLDISLEDLEVSNNPKMSIKDLIYPYIKPVIISSIIILIYFIIRYKKLGISKIIISSVFTVIGAQLILLSIYAIIRIPVNEITMPISMILFILSFILLIEKYEKYNKRTKNHKNN